jgi:hypothetical protein
MLAESFWGVRQVSVADDFIAIDDAACLVAAQFGCQALRIPPGSCTGLQFTLGGVIEAPGVLNATDSMGRTSYTCRWVA